MRLVKKALSLIERHKYIFLFSALYLGASFATYKDYGVTYDERVEYDSGKYLLSYVTQPTDVKYVKELVEFNPSFIENRQLPLFSTYSRIYPALLNILNPKYYFEWFHLQNLVFGLFLFLSAYLCFYLVYKDGRKAIIAPVLLFFTPTITGHIPANPKDIPFATVFIAGAVFLSYFLKRAQIEKNSNNWAEVLILGFIFGIAQGLRTVGLTLFAAHLILNVVKIFKDKQVRSKISALLQKMFVVFIVSLFTWILTVPYIGANFFSNIFTVLSNAAGYKNWDYEVLYMGKFLLKDERPWHYLFTYSAIQLPLVILLLLGIGIYFLLRKRIKFDVYHPVSVLSLLIFLNTAIYLLLHPVVYNTTRHFLYLLTSIVLIAGFFLIEIFGRVTKKVRMIIIGSVSAYLLFTFIRMAHLHPYEYVYYNELIGGLRGVEYKYELDYWGAAYKESAQLVASVVEKNKLENVKVYACDNQFAVVYFSRFKYSLVYRSKDSDIIICDTFKEQLRKVTGRDFYVTSHPIVKTITREGVPIHNIRATEPFAKYF